MEITLPPHLEAIVNKKVEGGDYASAGDVVREAMRRLDESEGTREQRIEEVRRKVAHGLSQAERGELYSFASGADAVEFIKSEGRKVLAERAKQRAGSA